MTVTLDHVTRSVDGIATIRDVSLTLEHNARGNCSHAKRNIRSVAILNSELRC
jgi:hypothetical protein